jgi:PAS domain S-box-containing protein
MWPRSGTITAASSASSEPADRAPSDPTSAAPSGAARTTPSSRTRTAHCDPVRTASSDPKRTVRSDPVRTASPDAAGARPASRPALSFTVQHCLPFLAVLVLATASPAIPHDSTPIRTWWLLACAMLAVLIVSCLLATRRSAGHWSQTVGPLLAFPVVALLRSADGNAASGFSPLYFLPVVFFVLYGRQRDVLITLAVALVAMLFPIVVVGPPKYPATGTRGALLLFVLFAAVGILISRLVESSRRLAGWLSVSEMRFRAAFEDAPLAMALTALTGPRAGSFTRVNRAACAFFGRSAEDLTSISALDLTHPDDRASTAETFAKAADPDASHRIQKRYLHSSGRTIWTEASFSVVRGDRGEPLHLVTAMENIGARRDSDHALLDALETERAATERMRELDNVRNELMSGVAHDLRTPLTAAAGFAELLNDETVGPLNAEQHTIMDTISRSLTRLGGMVDELIATSRRDRDRARRSPWSEVDVDALVTDAIEAASLIAHSKSLTVRTTRSAVGTRVLGDAIRLDRALVNLLGNAAKFTPDGGVVAVNISSADGEVVIRIADTGIGIPLQDQARIFERFYRSSDVVGKAIGGTGLGLAIVREIITQHGGAVSVDSEPGHGATFTVTLPLARAG